MSSFFHMVQESVLISFFAYRCSVFPAPLGTGGGDRLSSTVYSCLLCRRLPGRRFTAYFWALYSASVHPCPFCARTTLLLWLYCSFAVSAELREHGSCGFVLSSQNGSGYSGSFVFLYINFKIICSNSLKNMIILIWIALNF